MNREKSYWLDQPRNINKLVYILIAACAAFVLADLFYTKHPHFDFEAWFGFYGWFGFLAYTCIVMLGKAWRRLVKRDEDYYDRQP